ncbi:3'(2'),5'-bisphosphate nucleotidase CysQ [Sphingomonas sp. RB3P16]|uniref:3'(2'),5'-bisphosphate nucleotidase CysQ n=1 Tax=Parasphingomonas frigoris TaxID=3096163 RepID=UPI002FCC47A5
MKDSIIESDVRLAERLATEAGAILLALQASSGLTGKALGAAGDAQANTYLMRLLRAARPDDAILCEEEKDSGDRCAVSRAWIIDPLDGTREYGEGRADWAVHVALAIDGVATVGAVALPALGFTLTSGAPKPLAPAGDPLRMLVSRTRPAREAVAVAEAIGATLVPMGSAGAKAMAVVRGEADIYLHTGGQYEWDNCAPIAVAQAAGLHVSRVDGSVLRYNCADPYLPDLLICRAELAEHVLALVRDLPPAEGRAGEV